MQHLLTTALLSLLTLPFTNALSYITGPSTANFDDRTDNSDVGIYHSLHWHNLRIAQPHPNASLEETGGLYPKAHNSDDMLPATAYAVHDTTSVPTMGAARMSVSYFGSSISLFDLEEFTFGCTRLNLSSHEPTALPQSCMLAVKGYPPGRGIDARTGLQDLRGVRPSMEMVLWFSVPEDVDKSTKVRMVTMEGLNKSWWALGAVTFEAVGEQPVALCLEGFRYRTYSITDWAKPGKGIQELFHDERPLRRKRR